MEKQAERLRVPNIKKVDTYDIIEEVFPERKFVVSIRYKWSRVHLGMRHVVGVY